MICFMLFYQLQMIPISKVAWLLGRCTFVCQQLMYQQHWPTTPPNTLIFLIFLSASVTQRLSMERYLRSIVWYCSVVGRASLATQCNPFCWLFFFYHPGYHEQRSPRKAAAPHTCGGQQDPPRSWHHAESARQSLQQKRGTRIWWGCSCKYSASNIHFVAHDMEEVTLHPPPPS